MRRISTARLEFNNARNFSFLCSAYLQPNYCRRFELNFNWNSARLRIKFKHIAYLGLFKVLVIKIV